MNEVAVTEKGLIFVNRLNLITGCNESALKLLKRKNVIGKNINSVIDSLKNGISIEKTTISGLVPSEDDLSCYVITSNRINEELDLHRLNEILNHSYDEIFVVNKKGVIIFVNDACERHYGLKPNEIIGKKIYSLIEDGYYNPAVAPIVFKEKKRVTVTQETHIGKKLVVTATPILNDAGDIELVIMNSRDITEIEELKCDLEETKKLVNLFEMEVKELRNKELKNSPLVIRSKSMEVCIELAQKVATTDSTILILGESGTGKNVMAKHIHDISNRKSGPLKTINCAAIPEQLLESELFGYHRGAFTGANQNGKIGLLELADKGTLFLDEIGEIPLLLQAKLLEVIQDNRFIPIGSTNYKKIDVRIIAATNRNLEEMVEKGKFREDLYYRLNVIELEIPPLRKRKEDIAPLANYFLNKFDKKYKCSHYFSQKCLDVLISYPWAGNIRELQHVIERLVITVQESQILPYHLPKKLLEIENLNHKSDVSLDKPIHLDKVEKELIINAYKELGSSYKVAKALNISQSKANRKIRKYLLEEKSN